MKTIKYLITVGLLFLAGSAFAIPVPYSAEIVNGSWRSIDYSNVREAGRPWTTLYQFDDGQEIDLILDIDAAGDLQGITATNQQFTLDAGAELFNLIDLNIVIDGGSGRPEGSMDFSIVDAASNLLHEDTFYFRDIIWAGPFNSADLSHGSFYLYLWGNTHGDLGIDLAIVRVPEPGSLALLGLGILGLAGVARRRRTG